MLVIRCREGESISIGDDVEVTVLAASPGKVKLGFKAPVEVPVTRRCLEVTRLQNRAAVRGVDGSIVGGLASYLNAVEPDTVTCMISLQTVSESPCDSEECKQNSKKTIHRKVTAEKKRDDSIVNRYPGRKPDGT
jgi:carbon storage regulator